MILSYKRHKAFLDFTSYEPYELDAIINKLELVDPQKEDYNQIRKIHKEFYESKLLTSVNKNSISLDLGLGVIHTNKGANFGTFPKESMVFDYLRDNYGYTYNIWPKIKNTRIAYFFIIKAFCYESHTKELDIFYPFTSIDKKILKHITNTLKKNPSLIINIEECHCSELNEVINNHQLLRNFK